MNDEIVIERFRLTLEHEYFVAGQRIKIDEPIRCECVMPVNEMLMVPRYSREMIIEKLVNMLGDEEGVNYDTRRS